jgi:CBS domain containing-hemolysin-like protein
MDGPVNTLLLTVLTVVLVLLNGFFVATEFSIVKVRATRIRELADDGVAGAKAMLTILAQMQTYISATQIGVTLSSLALGWVGEPLVARGMVEPIFRGLVALIPTFHPSEGVITTISFIIGFSLVTFVVVTFGELAPKWLAIQQTEAVALVVSRPMLAFAWLFRPVIGLLMAAANGTLRLFGIKPGGGSELAHTEEELRMIISASAADQGGTLRETQTELLDNVLDFGERTARQVMVHRMEVLGLDVEDPLKENVRAAQAGGHTRYPAYREDLDSILGFIHTKDLYALYQRDPKGDITTIVREALLVPDSIRVDLLLRQMQRKRQQVALLVDEYGGTVGMVTIADLLEELVGELPDEFEPPDDDPVVKLSETAWSVDGLLPLPDAEEAIGRPLSCDETCDTVGGYAHWAFGRIPEAGDMVELNDLTLKVLAMDGRRVARVEMNTAPRERKGEENGNGDGKTGIAD